MVKSEASLALALVRVLPPLLLRPARLGPLASYEGNAAASDQDNAQQDHSGSRRDRPEPLTELRHCHRPFIAHHRSEPAEELLDAGSAEVSRRP
jgi:hypothetical protein